VNTEPRQRDDAVEHAGHASQAAQATAGARAAPAATRLGTQLLERRTLSAEDVARIMASQRETGQLFGETAVALGLLTREGLRRALAEQFAYPYVEVAGSALNPSLVSAHKPFSAQAESFRTLRSELLLRWFDQQHRTIAITLPRASHGASVVAANLAICLAQMGGKTLLIDANFRAAQQHKLFGLAGVLGLSTVLAGRSALADAMVTIQPFEDLTLLTAGPAPPNPQELLSRDAFSHLLRTASAQFEVIVIDTPPLLEFADAQLIAAHAGGCVLTTRRHQTSLADIELCKFQLGATGAEIVGTIIID
jgi:chain length determinant protein tyrosine kinase EpsG